MAYDEGLAQRIRGVLDAPSVEKKLFGGLAFMVDGNMCVGVIGDELLARMAPESVEAALARPGTRPFEMGGRVSKGWVLVGPGAVADDDALAGWVDDCLAYARTLPPK